MYLMALESRLSSMAANISPSVLTITSPPCNARESDFFSATCLYLSTVSDRNSLRLISL
ncbi:hypothetical protein MBAV_006403 [Candidatus Magnetobacterium bavaricum]|uniref:Uncharacterized protein n=1 Tax=Candidatus Magnetobacterium bavaricum TaxID=29290 RepID=A0A0F3GHP2_9BACT|nr:hypothetical protein MBAV_006403 [Candidatus Magnetobacterium bavaricum]